MANNVTDLGKVGITLKGEWSSSTSYERLDTVTYEGSLYIAVKDNVGSQPSESNINWMLGAKHGEFTEQQLEDFKAEVVAESKEEMDDYTDDKKTELDTYTGTKKTELDTYEGTKEAELNTYASGLKDDFDSNATSKTNTFNTNATSKTNDFDSNAVAKTTAFDTNASTKTSAFDDNATAKTTAFNENAEEKTGDFNDNVDTKTTEFDAHVEEKETEFDENVDSIQEQITDIQEFIDSELEQGITEKGTRADVSDSAKWYGELAPEGRTEQKQLQGYNLFDYAQVVNLAFGTRQGESSSYILVSSLYRGYYIPVTPGEQYFVSRKNTTDFNRFRYCYTEIEPAVNVSVISGSQKTRDTYTSFDTVVPEGAGYLFIYLTNEGTDITSEMEVQITKSEELLPYEPYVGGTASPNPDYPQEIQNVEGRSYRNLFDINAEYERMAVVCKFTFHVKPNTQYTISTNCPRSNTANLYVNSNISSSKAYINSPKTITSDENGKFYISLRFAASQDDPNTFDLFHAVQNGEYWVQVEEGSTATPYEPYFEGKRLDFNVCNKNLFDENTVEFIDGLLDDNGQPMAGGSHYTSNFYRVKPSLAYKILGTTTTDTATKRIYFYDINKNWISRSQQMGLNNVQFTTPDNCYYIRLQVSNTVTLKTGDVMLCEGIDDTYVEHNQQIIPFPLAEGQKLMEGDYLADDGVHHTKRQIVLKGTENYVKNTEYADSYSFVLNSYRTITDSSVVSNVKCNMLHASGTNEANTIRLVIANGNIAMAFAKNFVEHNVEALKAKLAQMYADGTPIVIEFPLLNETIDPYTPAQAEAYNNLMNLKLYKGVNHIWTNTDGLEPNLQLTYYKSNKERLNNIEARLELLEE